MPVIEFEAGKEYELVDGCGIVIQTGKYVGTVYPVYDEDDREWVGALPGLFVFDLGPRTGYSRYAGTNHLTVRMAENAFTIDISTAYYGDSPESLRLCSEPKRPVGWSFDRGG